MAQYDVDALNAEIVAFRKKYKSSDLETADEVTKFIADGEALAAKYPDPEGESCEMIAKFYCEIGCYTAVFGQDLERGIPYYHKAIETCPESYDIRFDYITTLQEIIPKKNYRTPEILQDAVDNLTFCLNACDTWEKKRKHGAVTWCEELAKVYKILGQPKLAKEYNKMGKEIYKELVRRSKKGID